ncbi:MAG: helix-turn-helix domain-containing protein [Hyphomicrobiaceae bacterium]
MSEHEQSCIQTSAEAAHFLQLNPQILEAMRSGGIERDGSPYLTVAETAAYLRLKPRTLDNMRCNGIGPIYCKHGGRICYSFRDVIAWSRARRRRSTAEKAP